MPSRFYSYYLPEQETTVAHYRDQYDESIRFLDAEFEKFMNFLDKSPWADNLLIVLTSDHGESFERGYFNHGEELYENSTRVPLIIDFLTSSTLAGLSGLCSQLTSRDHSQNNRSRYSAMDGRSTPDRG